jgi:hypothetical protein
MAIFRVFNRPGNPADRAVFVKEGFSGAAFVFSVVWALWNRMWIVAATLLAVLAAIAILANSFNLGEVIPAVVNFAISLLFGFEAKNLKCWSLQRAGYTESGIVQGQSRDETEFEYFHARFINTVPPFTAAPKMRQDTAGDTLGLFGTA